MLQLDYQVVSVCSHDVYEMQTVLLTGWRLLLVGVGRLTELSSTAKMRAGGDTNQLQHHITPTLFNIL